MIISVCYVIAFVLAIIAVAIIKKNNNKINIVNEIFNAYIFVICFDAACALIMTWINIPVKLMSIMICNIVFSSLIYIYVKRIGRKQEFFISYVDIFFTALIFTVVGAIAWHLFDGFTIGYNSGDSATHFSFAMGIIRNEKVSAMYFDAFYNAMIIEALAPILKVSQYHIGLEIADTLILFVLTEMIYITISGGKNTKKENYKVKTLRNNYKTAIDEQIKGGNITKKQGKQLLKYMKSLSDNDLIKWFYSERKAVSVFNYIDTSREYTKNQMLVNEQLSKGIKHDLSDVTDSLAVASGNAYVRGGVVKYRK